MSRSMRQWITEYGESHQNKTNKLIHWFDVPGIVLTVMAMLWVIPTPALFNQVPLLNWATLVMVITTVWYLRLSVVMGIGMFLYFSLCAYLVHLYQKAGLPVLETAVVVFVVLWVLQAIGHKIEGKKPSFIKDVQFLLIGPAWVLSFLFDKVGIKY